MKLPLYTSEKQKSGEKELPSQFEEEYRPDLIRRAVLALQSAGRSIYGASPEAGKRHSSKLSKRRRKYRGCYGFGISRVNRKILSRRGTRMFWVGAFSPQTVGGRRAHPPKSEKIFLQKINSKERRKAIRSAISASLNAEVVKSRGHNLPEGYPFVVDAKLEQIKTTKDLRTALTKLGFEAELDRSSEKKVRAGIGKLRGRKYRRKRGLLILVGDECPALKAAKNIPGVDIVQARAVNAELLAPGAEAGRVALWTEGAIDIIGKENLFI